MERSIMTETVGDRIKKDGVEGTVISLDIPRRKYVLLTDENDKIEVNVPLKDKYERKSHK